MALSYNLTWQSPYNMSIDISSYVAAYTEGDSEREREEDSVGKKKKVVCCEICLLDDPPAEMVYQGGDQWTHKGECRQLFSDHQRNIDKRSIYELLREISMCTRQLTEFQTTRGGDREYSIRSLQEERSQATVALHRRLRAANWVLRDKYSLPRDVSELFLKFLGGSLRRDLTPKF